MRPSRRRTSSAGRILPSLVGHQSQYFVAIDIRLSPAVSGPDQREKPGKQTDGRVLVYIAETEPEI